MLMRQLRAHESVVRPCTLEGIEEAHRVAINTITQRLSKYGNPIHVESISSVVVGEVVVITVVAVTNAALESRSSLQ